MKKTLIFLLTLVFGAGMARADVLAEWTFNDNSSLAAALGSSGVAAGATVSGLAFNASLPSLRSSPTSCLLSGRKNTVHHKNIRRAKTKDK